MISLRRTALFAAMLTAAGAAASAASIASPLHPAALPIRTPPSALVRTHQPSPQWIQSHLETFRKIPQALSGRLSATSTYPLNGPWAMTIAPNGDLYVANEYANQVLVYGTNLVQKTSNTITAGLSNPTGVTFNSLGELYVANIASSSITVYGANRAYLPSRTLASNIDRPAAIAFDGLDDLLVDDNFTQVALFSYAGTYLGNIASPSSVVDSIATRSRFIGWGAPTLAAFSSSAFEIEGLGNGQSGGGAHVPTNTARGVAFDANENLYWVSDDDIVAIANIAAGSASVLVQLPFDPQAIAVDSAHNHIFVSDFHNNAIAVYTLAGAPITTLH